MLGKSTLLTGYFNGVQWIGEVQCEAGRFTVCSDCEMEQQQTVYMRFAEDKNPSLAEGMKILLEKGKNVMQILRRFLKNWMNSFREWRNEVSAVPHRLFFETDVKMTARKIL